MEKLVSVMRQGICLYLLLLLVTWVTGCGPTDLQPTRRFPVNFGDVYVGTSATLSASWTNNGNHTVEMVGLSIEPGGAFSHPSTPATFQTIVVLRGNSTSVPITFRPSQERDYTANATPWLLWATAESIELRGRGVAQKRQGVLGLNGLVAGQALGFGDVLVGGSATRSFNVFSMGGNDVDVTARWSTSNQGFTVTAPGNSFAVSAPPPTSSSVPVTITFAPPDVGPFTDAVTFSDAGGTNLAGTAVSGNGVAQKSVGALSVTDGDLVAGQVLDFKDVPVGGRKTLTFNIQNNSANAITVDIFWSKGNQGFGPRPPVQILVQNSTPVTITFTPPDVGPFTDAVTFSDAGGTNLAGTAVKGNGIREE